MTNATIAPSSSDSSPVASQIVAALDALRARLAGDLITPGTPSFDVARKVHDVTIDRRPLAIVRAAAADDVAEAVRFAGRHGCTIAVRSGGHSVAGHSMADGAVVVDLSAMRGISIDPERRTARVQPGVTSGDLAGPAHAYGLALSTGDTSSVGLGGLTTGGGIGWMARAHGLAIDNVLSVEIVTADGGVVRASANVQPDLFWAIRGGGGNFGIVTEFEFQLAPVGQVLGGALMLPASREVIRGYLDYAAAAPDGLTTVTNLMHAPPAPFVPAGRVGELVLTIMACWTGDPEAGERALAPLRALAEPMADTISLIPYPVMYAYTQAAAAPGALEIRHMFVDELSDAAIDAALGAMARATSPMSMVQFRGLGGAIGRVRNAETAYAHRDRRYLMAVLGIWLDAAQDAAPHRAWVESLWGEIRREGRGAYANFLADEGQDRVRDAYPAGTFRRLLEVKREYDPANLFALNQNIR